MATFGRPYLGPESTDFGSEIGPYKCSHRLPYPSARMSGDGPFSVLWEWISVLWEWISMLWLLWTCIGRVHVQLGCKGAEPCFESENGPYPDILADGRVHRCQN